MLHFTSGNAILDVGRSLELTGMALHLACGYYHHIYGEDYQNNTGEEFHNGVLKHGGHLVMKIYEGSGTNDFVKDTQKFFSSLSRMKPDASRKSSRESYVICKG